MDRDFSHVVHTALSPQDHLQSCTAHTGVLKKHLGKLFAQGLRTGDKR